MSLPGIVRRLVDKPVPKRLLWSCWIVLRAASVIVPRQKRAEWFLEWHGEVWHWTHFLVESERLSPRTEQELLRHCWGAFPDALWHRLNRTAVLDFLHNTPLSPGFCLIALVATLSVLVAGSPMSISWWSLRPRLQTGPMDLLTVSPNSRSHWLEPELLRDAATDWARRSPLIAQAETYAWRPSVIRGPAGKEEVLSARVTPGMFGLFGTSPVLGRTFEPTDPSPCETCVVLSHAIWHSQFHKSSQAIGARISLNGQQMEIIGVFPEQFHIPGMDIGLFTLFGPGSQPRMPGLEWVSAIVRVPANPQLEKTRRDLQKFVNQTSDLPPNTVFDVLSSKDIQYQWLESCAASIAFAILLLTIINWRTAARLCATGPRRAITTVFRWYLFFAVKSGLLLVVVLAGSFDVLQIGVLRFGHNAHNYVDGTVIWVFLVGLTVALMWSVYDQHSRCRTCLRRLRMRVELGSSVGTFCEPSGAELVCDMGHGMLHLPAMHFSCLDSERWTDLHESWRVASAVQAGASTP
jgi:hypothetical protein